MKKLWCLFVICFAAVSLASTYELKKAPQSLEDWTNGEFYNGEAPPADATAEVFLPENTTSKVDNASIAYVGSFRVIRPRGMAALLVDVSTNAVFHAAFTPSVKTRPNERGLFIKRGVGFLQLASLGNVPRWNGDNQLLEHQFDYDSNFRVEAGVLKMPDRGLGATGKIITDFFLNDITVLKGGVFAPSASEFEAAATTWLNAIRGDGSISNNVGKGDHCVFRPRYSGVEPCVFSGSIDGKMLFYTSAHLHLTGTESTLESGGFRITENTDTWTKGILGVGKIGKNSQEASSLGKYSYVSLGEMGSRLLYLGSGEQTGKFFYFFETSAGKKYPSIIDAGAAGGITFTGNWLSNTGDGYICRLHLDGSNTVPCVVESAAPAGTGAAGGKLLYVVKKGSGTWRFTGNADRSAFSGWAIENGVLSFDSLKERGVNCSLGACSRFYEDSWGLVSNFTEAPYCFRLGAQNSCGTMQYIGSSLLFCSTRPMVLGGDGRLENAGESRSIFQSGISALSAGVKQLILSGENENENIITDITDGEGSVKVVKTGSGTWTLSGTNNVFTGGIEVRGGKLVLQGVSGRFKWWRLTIRELWGNINEIQMHELGLYDKDGVRVNGGLVRDDELTGLSASSTYNERNLRRLLPGKVAYGRELERRMNGSGERVLDELFNDADLSGGGFGIQFMANGFSDWIYPKENNPETWLPIVMRHNDSANEVKSYDLSIRHAPNWGRMPRSWILEGSVDGETWWTVDDVSCADNASKPKDDDSYSYWWWYADSSCAVGTASTHNAGKPISGSTNLTAIAYNCPVSVAAGATLEADGLVELSSLRINPSSAGTIKGVAFAEQGTVEITERLRGSTKLALNFVDCGATERLKQWKVTVKGSSGEWLARVVDGKIVVSPRIFAIVVR